MPDWSWQTRDPSDVDDQRREIGGHPFAMLSTCWRKGCRVSIHPDDSLGLCNSHREVMKEW